MDTQRFPVIHPNIIRQVLFLLILLFLGFVVAKEMYFMFGSFLGAVTLYVILMYPVKYLTIYKRWPAWVSALVLMLVSIIVLILPLGWMVSVIIERMAPLISDPQPLKDALLVIDNFIVTHFDVQLLTEENLQTINAKIFPLIQETLGGTLSALGGLFIMYLILFFLLTGSKNVERWLRKSIPFKSSNVKLLISETRRLVYSNAVGIPLVAIVQGVIASLGYWFFDVDKFILLGLLTAISSVVPLVGTLLVYVPLGIYQWIESGMYSGLGVLLWGFIVIGSVDNISRFLLQKKIADVHPLVTLFGVVIGINLFGFIGVVYGPLLLSIFFLLVRVYINEFGTFRWVEKL